MAEETSMTEETEWVEITHPDVEGEPALVTRAAYDAEWSKTTRTRKVPWSLVAPPAPPTRAPLTMSPRPTSQEG